MNMNEKMGNTERSAATWNRFCEMVRKANSRRSRSDLEFYTHSAVPALLAMQSCFKQEQL